MPTTRRSTGRGRSSSSSNAGHRSPSESMQDQSSRSMSGTGSRSRSQSGSQRGQHRSQGSRTGNGRHQGRAMIETLEEGFLTELADMLDGENQLLKTLQKFSGSVENPQLRDAFERHLEQTHDHVSRLEQVFQIFGRKPETDRCEGLQGIVTEGDEILRKATQGPLRDAMIIAAAQKAEHYEIASYGALCAWADQLGEQRAVRLLEETLSEEKMTDRMLTRMAESFANQRAPGRRGEREFGRESRFNEEDRFGRGNDRNRHFGEERDRQFDDDQRNRGFQGGMRGRGDWEPPYSDDRSRSRYGREKRYDE